MHLALLLLISLARLRALHTLIIVWIGIARGLGLTPARAGLRRRGERIKRRIEVLAWLRPGWQWWQPTRKRIAQSVTIGCPDDRSASQNRFQVSAHLLRRLIAIIGTRLE